ncbi:MAG: hypothetical protein A2033_08830 [Bacteroidetes bacterium GWA2_31_9]|nr:MAG: hypothetical protein A2033_08830 [Bacteroidetes bacterium GWA2_31_9]
MEAIIKAKDIKTFQAVIQFLKSLNFEVTIKENVNKSESSKNKLSKSQKEKSSALDLIGLYNSGVTDGSLNHDKEIYGK